MRTNIRALTTLFAAAGVCAAVALAPVAAAQPRCTTTAPNTTQCETNGSAQNVAANVSAGAQYGFLLVWVIIVANAMAGLVQFLSAKLGLVTGRSLPEAVADHSRTRTRIAYWLQAELVAMATDLAEVVGGAIA